jgi:hypothetical protein
MCRMWEVVITCSISDKEGLCFLNEHRICFLRDISVRVNIFWLCGVTYFICYRKSELRAKSNYGILVDINPISVE